MLNYKETFCRAQEFLDELAVQLNTPLVVVQRIEISLDKGRNDVVHINDFWFLTLKNFIEADVKDYVKNYIEQPRETPIKMK